MKPKEIKDLSKHTAVDHIVNIIKALVSTYPYGGSLVASLINDYIPKSREKRIREFLEKLARNLEAIKEYVDANYVKSDEFIYLFQKALRIALEHYQEEKIEGFRAILLNSAIGKEATADERDLFINILDDITGFHFQMLRLFKNPKKWNENHGNPVTPQSIIISINQILKNCFPEWDEERITIIVDSLHSKKLINISSDRLKVGLSGGGIEKIAHVLTPFGRRFIDYVTLDLKTTSL